MPAKSEVKSGFYLAIGIMIAVVIVTLGAKIITGALGNATG